MEILKDKYLCLVLVVILLAAYIYTSNATLETLLTTAVGGFLGLMKSGAGNLITGGTDNKINPPANG
jgi:hypothetical protein